MNAKRNWFSWGQVPAAAISLLIGVIAVSVIPITTALVLPDSISGNGSIDPMIPVTGVPVPLSGRMGGISIGIAAGFLFGLAGLVTGCSCLPESRTESHADLRRWLAGVAIGLGVIAMLFHFGLASFLSTYSQALLDKLP
jgi:uncharacterized membrane protein